MVQGGRWLQATQRYTVRTIPVHSIWYNCRKCFLGPSTSASIDKISIQRMPSMLQLADIATMPQPKELFVDQCECIVIRHVEYATSGELVVLAFIHLEACDETERARPAEVLPQYGLDQVQQRESIPKQKG
jgi:hypothetical protein